MPLVRDRPKAGEVLAPQTRALSIRSSDAPTVDIETRTCTFPFSSEEPVDMWIGTEVLSHAPGAMRMGVRQQALALLFNHDRDDLLGVVESISLGKDSRAYCTVRFGRDERGEWAMQQAADGVLINASFMYQVYRYEVDEETDTWTALDWEVYEVSLVTIPADATVGMGRSAGEQGAAVDITIRARASPADPPDPAAPRDTPPASAGFFMSNEGESTMPRRHFHQLRDAATDGSGQGQGSGGAASSTPPVLDAPPAHNAERARVDGAADERARS